MPNWIAVCAINDVDLEDVIPFEHAGAVYAIYRSPDNLFFATDGHCTHEDSLLCDGLVIGNIIECSKHNGRFDYTTGETKGGPVVVDLKTYGIKIDNDTVHIEIN